MVISGRNRADSDYTDTTIGTNDITEKLPSGGDQTLLGGVTPSKPYKGDRFIPARNQDQYQMQFENEQDMLRTFKTDKKKTKKRTASADRDNDSAEQTSP